MKTEEKVKNAIIWIDTLPNYKQAEVGLRGVLGDYIDGYCCLGAGCAALSINFLEHDGVSHDLQEAVGLIAAVGHLPGNIFFGYDALTKINDHTLAGFKRISGLLKTHPDWMFIEEVAQGIKDHYSKDENN